MTLHKAAIKAAHDLAAHLDTLALFECEQRHPHAVARYVGYMRAIERMAQEIERNSVYEKD